MPQVNVSVDINASVYLRDPMETALGKRIIYHAIILFDEVGFEAFNFRKLALSMSSTEASVYRYFENKYKLLAYLVAWYWDYTHFMILMDTRNIDDPQLRLQIMIKSMVNIQDDRTTPDYINLSALHRIVVENAARVYHHRHIEDLHKQGFYTNLPKLVNKISETIKAINPDFKYPKTLATNIIELSLNNEYYLEHLPELSDAGVSDNEDPRQATTELISYFLERLL